MTEPLQSSSRAKHRDGVGWDAIVEDLFGLSWRALETIWHVFVRPAEVFEAARTQRWLDRYTPSIRLVLSLIAVMLVLRIIWGGSGSPMYEQIYPTMEVIAAENPSLGTATELADQYWTGWALVTPFAYLLAHFIGALSLRIWGEGTPFAVRLRLYFTALIPGLFLALVTLILTRWVADSQMLVYLLSTTLFLVVVYFVTALRGLRRTYEAAARRVWRAGLFAFVALMFDLVGSTLASLLAGVIIALSGRGVPVPGL